MAHVNFGDYLKELHDFAEKHNENGGVKTYTSPMKNDRYHKEICWEDGAAWYEVTELIWETVPVTVHGVDANLFCQLWRTEFWSTDDGHSKYTYQKA